MTLSKQTVVWKNPLLRGASEAHNSMRVSESWLIARRTAITSRMRP